MTLVQTENLNVLAFDHMPSPDEVKVRVPLTESAAARVVAGRQALMDILDRRDPRHFVVAGPCSIHDPVAGIEYAHRLKALGLEVRTEKVPMARTWTRGKASASLGGKPVRLVQHAWTPATGGPVQAPLVLLPLRQAFAVQDLPLKGAVVLTILSLYVLVALVSFAFINTGNVLIGFGGLIIGIIALLVDLRAGNNWYISAGWLVIYGLFVAVMVS